MYIKVVELEPKITTLGANLDESIRLQNDHDETLRNVQVRKMSVMQMPKNLF